MGRGSLNLENELWNLRSVRWNSRLLTLVKYSNVVLHTFFNEILELEGVFIIFAAKFDVSSLTTIDLLRKDFKIVPQGQKPVKVCISSVSLPLGDFFSRENAHKDTEKFCSILNLDVLVLMPIYFEPKSDIPKRQIGVCGPSRDAVKQVADYLASSSELRLSPISTGQLPGWAAYDQGNATASRKVVFPLVMKFLSGLK